MAKFNVKDHYNRRTYHNKIKQLDLDSFFKKLMRRLVYFVKSNLQTFGNIKVLLVLNVDFKKKNEYGETIYTSPYFSSAYTSFCTKFHISKKLRDMLQNIICTFDCYCVEGSGWQLDFINFLEIKAVKIEKAIIGAGDYHISDLPSKLKMKHCILNVSSPENMCFHYSVAASIAKLSRKMNPHRSTHYKDLVQNFTLVQTPMVLDQIPEFEILNKININVFTWKNNTGRLLYTTMNKNPSYDQCNLLLYKKHFFVIRNVASFLTQNKSKRCNPCMLCYATFSRKHYLDKHLKVCSQSRKQSYTVPKRQTFKQFENFKHLIKCEYVIYADFEACLVPYDKMKSEKTQSIQKHIPVSFGAMRVSCNPEHNSSPYIYHGKNVMKRFFRYLEKQQDEIDNYHEIEYDLHMTDETESKYKNSTKCDFCHTPFSKKVKKCRDHSHILPHNNFRYALCNTCNLTHASSRTQSDIPILFHNLSKYDSKIIISALGKVNHKLGKIKIIPKSSEQFISFNIGRYRFIDSYQFLNASLSTLVENLKGNDLNEFKFTKQIHPKLYPLLIKKQPYPYSFAKCLHDYNKIGLPHKSAFYDDLRGKQITNEDYEHAKHVFLSFNCKRFIDYHLLYLKTDVCLLADIYEANRNLCIATYGLDPVYYLSSSQFTLDAFLRSSGTKLECLPDLKMFELFERAKRGGISCITRRFAQANNTFMGDTYDENKDDNFLYYVDANNLYGKAMTGYLPSSNFHWVYGTFKELSDKILNTPKNSDIGYLCEVSLIYPKSLHDLTNDFPLACDKLSITTDMISPYSKNLRNKLYNEKKINSVKLAPNLYNKSHYVAHYENIKYYVQRGMILTEIHSLIGFTQSCWLSNYVKINTEKRSEATTQFAKSFYKNLVNKCFGKLCENVRNRMQLYLVNTESMFHKLVRKPNFKKFTVFSRNLVAIEMLREKIELKVPIYAGVTILELSKLHMYRFHEIMTTKLYNRDEIELCFCDTDSFLFTIKTKHLYKDLKKIRHHLDTSNYPSDHILYSNKSKLVVGKMKDECPPYEKMLIEFCGLKSKMYSLLDIKNVNKIKAKGISKAALDHITHVHYTRCLNQEISIPSIIYSIRSFKHKLFTIKSTRSSLNGYDDKRWVCENGIDTYAYGHYRINQNT